MPSTDRLRRGTLLIAWLAAVLGAAILFQRGAAFDASPAPEGWVPTAPRDEIRPQFSVEPHAGPNGEPALVIRADKREGLAGFWKKSFPVGGGKFYHFAAQYKAANVAVS